MDFAEFDHEISKVLDYLRELLDAGAGFGTIEIFGQLADSSTDIKIITERIDKELVLHSDFIKKFLARMSKELEPVSNEMEKMVRNSDFLRLDVKSFFIFTRIFYDTICRFIRLTYGDMGIQLPRSMNRLLTRKSVRARAIEMDKDFFSGFFEVMSGFHEIRDKRDEIVHSLGSMRSTTAKNGTWGFDIIGLRDKGRSWGTNTVQSISGYIEETIKSLTEALRFISKKRLCRARAR